MPEFDSRNATSEGRWTISRVEQQKRNHQRYAIYLDDAYAFSVEADTLVRFSLAVGGQLSEKQIEVIQFHDQFELAKNLAVKYLGLRARSHWEVQTYLRRKKIDPIIIARVIRYCQDNGYIDDENFASAFVRDRLQLTADGILKIKKELISKGIARDIVTRVTRDLVDPEAQLKKAIEIGKKKLKTLSGDTNIRNRLYRYLSQKGYPGATIFKALKILLTG